MAENIFEDARAIVAHISYCSVRFSVMARNGSSMARPLTTITVTPTIVRTYLGLHGKDSTEAVNTARKRDDYLVILDMKS